jgi:hypothetical protein
MNRRAFLTVLAATLAGGSVAPLGAEEPLLATPPKGAVVLFDGKSADLWHHGGDRPVKWSIEEGALVVKPRAGNIYTKEPFQDFTLHLEFNLPYLPDRTGQSKANSGVKLHGLYEIQILDSLENPTYPAGGCGSIYRQKDPDKNVSRKPGEWQTYDITFRAPRFDEKPRVTLVWNGVKVHDNVEIKGITNAKAESNPLVKQGPLMLQDHGSPVKFRNIWILPAKTP